MPHFELKRYSDYFLRRSSTKEEKTPIVKKSPKIPDSGSIGKDSKMNGALDSKSTYDSLIGSGANPGEEDDPKAPPKMSLLRKLCFFLSLNGGVVYVAALLWWIPCKHPLCLLMENRNWTVVMNGHLTTNMEIKSTPLSTSVLFGMADENGGKLVSLSAANGMVGWNKSTDNLLRNVFCDLGSFGDGNTIVPGCIVTAHNYIGAFTASNGSMLWERNITDPATLAIHKVALAGNPSTGPLVLAISDQQMFLLGARNGTLLSTMDLPCSWTVGMKLVGPYATQNSTSWIVVCEFGDGFEVWSFLEKEVLSLPKDFDDGPFQQLFSRGSGNSGSIDLAGDVTRTPTSLAFSWADSVVMVTEQAPFHHLPKSWERRFGDTSAVTSIVSGRFTNLKEHQIAVTVQNGSNTTLHILESMNGTSEVVTSLGKRSVMSMQRIDSGERNVDTLVIESISPKEKEDNSSDFHPILTRREYFTVKYSKKMPTIEHIVSADAYSSTFKQFTEGAADLLIASQSQTGTIINRYVLISKLEDKCR